MTNKDIERLCKRHMARTLSEIRAQECGLHSDVENSILKGYSLLMSDLKQLKTTKEEYNNGKNKIY